MTNLAVSIPPEQIKNAGDPVFPELRAGLHGENAILLPLVNRREAYGIAKYGQTLMTDDGRDTPTEVVNELLDMLVYLTKWYMQDPDASIMQLMIDARALAVKTVNLIQEKEEAP